MLVVPGDGAAAAAAARRPQRVLTVGSFKVSLHMPLLSKL